MTCKNVVSKLFLDGIEGSLSASTRIVGAFYQLDTSKWWTNHLNLSCDTDVINRTNQLLFKMKIKHLWISHTSLPKKQSLVSFAIYFLWKDIFVSFANLFFPVIFTLIWQNETNHQQPYSSPSFVFTCLHPVNDNDIQSKPSLIDSTRLDNASWSMQWKRTKDTP
jgi:hypothetical protein